ncbi:hypothetical protein ACWGK1_11220 [Streptomyces wedmorensis]
MYEPPNPARSPSKADVSDYDKKKYGFAFMALGEEAKKAYVDQIAALDEAIKAPRVPACIPVLTGGGNKGRTTTGTAGLDDDADGEKTPPPPVKEDRNYVKATCQCSPAAAIRVSPRILRQAEDYVQRVHVGLHLAGVRRVVPWRPAVRPGRISRHRAAALERPAATRLGERVGPVPRPCGDADRPWAPVLIRM